MVQIVSHKRVPVWMLVVLAVAFIVCFSLPSDWILEGRTELYLPLHTALEFIAILVSIVVFTTGWATYRNVRSNSILLLSVSSLWVGLLDFGHTLSYPGMPDFITPNHGSKSIYFWLAARVSDALALTLVPLFHDARRTIRGAQLLLGVGSVLWTGACFTVILFFPDLLPTMFVPGQGLTTAKIAVEWAIIALLLGAAFMNFKTSRQHGVISFHWLSWACLILAFGGLFFTAYVTVSDFYNFAGHLFKAVAFLFIFRAVFIECVSMPYAEMHRYAKEAKEANEAKTRFLANVSHEFRSPLTVIAGYSDYLLAQGQLGPRAEKWAHVIKRNSVRLNELIKDLLVLSKTEMGHLEIREEAFSLHDLLTELEEDFRLAADEKGVAVAIRIEPGLPPLLRGDRLRLHQILVNLVSNALKFTFTGAVEITASLDGTGDGPLLRVSVRDTGIGIPREQAARLFQPFSRLENGLDQRLGGSGLGLALSRALARRLGGELWLESSVPGQGSEFRLTMPLGSLMDTPTRNRPAFVEPVRARSREESAAMDVSGGPH